MTDTLSADVEGLFPVEEVQEQPETVEAQVEPETQPEEQKETEQPQEVVQEPEAQATEEKQAHTVPLATFLDKRDEAKELKRQVAEMQRQLQEYQKPQQPVAIPDPYEQPEEYQRYVQNQVEDQAFRLRLDMSGQFAEQQHGKDVVQAAVAWAEQQGQTDQTFGVRLRGQQNPVGWVVDQYKRDQFFSQYGSDPTALAQLQGAQTANQGHVAPQAVAPATPKQAPPRSLVAAPSTAGHQKIPDGSVLDSVKFNLD